MIQERQNQEEQGDKPYTGHLGQIVKIDPEAELWSKAVMEYAMRRITNEQLDEFWPSYELDPIQRLKRKISRRLTGFELPSLPSEQQEE